MNIFEDPSHEHLRRIQILASKIQIVASNIKIMASKIQNMALKIEIMAPRRAVARHGSDATRRGAA
eukprot:9018307-Karenia_brevis.AAC.1